MTQPGPTPSATPAIPPSYDPGRDQLIPGPAAMVIETEGNEYAHLMILAMLGKTAVHLRDVHMVEPADDKRANAAAHMRAHSLPEDARWSHRHRQFYVRTPP